MRKKRKESKTAREREREKLSRRERKREKGREGKREKEKGNGFLVNIVHHQDQKFSQKTNYALSL